MAIEKTVPFRLIVTEVPPPPDFFPAFAQDVAEVPAGTVATYQIGFLVDGGYAAPIRLAVSGLPAGAVATFDVNPVLPTDVAVLSIMTEGVAAGEYALELVATEVEAAPEPEPGA